MKQKIEDLKTITHEMLKRNDENVNELEEVNHRYDVVEEMSSKGTSAEIELKKVSNWVDSKTKVLDDFNSKSSTLKQESLKTNQEIQALRKELEEIRVVYKQESKLLIDPVIIL